MADTPPAETEDDVVVEIRGQTFRFLGEIPVMLFADFAAAGMPTASDADKIDAIRSFEKYMCHPDDRERLHDLLRSARPAIGDQELTEIVGLIMERIAARQGIEIPTPAPSPSSPGGGATPSTSPVSPHVTAVVD